MSIVGKAMRLPQWARVLTMVGGVAVVLGALLAAAGIAGDAATTVKDPVYVDQDSSGINGDMGAANGFVTTGKEMTAFNAAVVTYAGDIYYVQLSMVNQSSNTTFDEVLRVTGPAGFEFEVAGGSNIGVSKKTVDSWIVRIGTAAAGLDIDDDPEVATSTLAADELRIKVTVGPGVATGFYQVKANMTLLKEED